MDFKSIVVYFDRDKIEKILYNLLSNAFKYTPNEGNITVEISKKTNKTDHEIDFLEISIKNSGHGIDKENLNNIFNRFFQETDQSEYSQSGTGIGLSLVKNLIELHKGYVNVKSELDKHTEFIIGIPFDDTYKKEEKLKAPTAYSENKLLHQNTISTQSTTTLKKKNTYTLLIVEDNDDLRNFLAQTLSDEYDILTAENGEIGLKIAQNQKPNAIISDIMMPKMSGLDLCKTLKSDPKTSYIPIILLTARTATAIELDSYDTGANDFISKPFNIKILKSKIHNLVNSMDNIKKRSRKEVLLEDSEINNSSADEEFLEKLSNFIRDNITDTDLNVNKTGEQLGISRVHLYRKVKKITGKTPVEFIRNFRLSAAAKLLEQDAYNINEVCYKIGFQDVGYFRKCFKKKYNISASEFIEKSKQTSIND